MIAPLITCTFVALLTVVLPWMAWASRRQIAKLGDLPRAAFYGQALFVQLLIGLFALAVAHVDHITLTFALPAAGNPEELKLAVSLMAAALILLLVGFRTTTEQQKTLLRLLAPRNHGERVFWTLLCLVVAFAEEVTYRAVLPRVFSFIPNILVVVILCSVIFGAAHLLQGIESAVLAALIGFGLHLLVLTAGRLNSAIVVHFVYDVVAGFYIGHKLQSEAEVA